MIHIGIDQSLTATGLVSLRDDSNRPVTAWRLSTKLVGVERLLYLRDAVSGCIYTADEKPPLVTMEGYGFSARNSHSHSLGELGGLLKAALYEMGVVVAIVPPSTLKKYATDSGAAPKDVMLKSVFKRWSYDTNDNNIADAYALAKMARTLLLPRTKVEQQWRKKVELIVPPGCTAPWK